MTFYCISIIVFIYAKNHINTKPIESSKRLILQKQICNSNVLEKRETCLDYILKNLFIIMHL